MILKDISFDSPEENILFDDVLLYLAEKEQFGEFLRFWESQRPFIVLGRISKESYDVKEAEAQKDNIPIIRRSSGGGTVLQGKGCLNYSLILSKRLRPEIVVLNHSYHFILRRVISALKHTGIDACYFPISDIALSKTKKKISGNAQRRLKNYILHHGTILYDFDLEKIEKYLKLPQSVPDYRLERSHLDFVSNISSNAIDFKNALKKEFILEKEEDFMTSLEKKYLELFKERYYALRS